MNKWFFKKTALVTGATSGIGREIAKQLVCEGCRVLLCGKICSIQKVNISAVVNLCRAFLPRMVERSGGGILNVGSTSSFFATPGSALYGATKHFILGFTDALHQEMLSFGVHVTGVYPDRIESRFLERATDGKIKGWEKAMSPVLVAKLTLRGLSDNRMRVTPSLASKIRTTWLGGAKLIMS